MTVASMHAAYLSPKKQILLQGMPQAVGVRKADIGLLVQLAQVVLHHIMKAQHAVLPWHAHAVPVPERQQRHVYPNRL